MTYEQITLTQVLVKERLRKGRWDVVGWDDYSLGKLFKSWTGEDDCGPNSLINVPIVYEVS